jgi:hypothetical protein
MTASQEELANIKRELMKIRILLEVTLLKEHGQMDQYEGRLKNEIKD